MQLNNENTQSSATFINDVRMRLSKDGEHLLIFLPGGRIVRKHTNFVKRAMGLPFVPKTSETTDVQEAAV